MREIDATIKARILNKHQTAYTHNEHSMEIIVSRPRTAIAHQRYWQESIVTAGATAVCTSVAIKRTGRWGEKVYVAYVDSTGLLTVKTAPLRYPIRSMVWTTVTTIAGCAACALEFDGSFVQVGRHIEFRTDSVPWLFYTTSSGQLMAGILGGSYESLVGANVTAIDAVRGVASKYKDIDQGLLVFYIINGSVYYREYINGSWGSQETVDIAPANAVSIKAERTFDWRIVLQITDASGALFEVFSRAYVSGWANTEELTASVTGMTVDVYEINYQDNMAPDEHITAFTPELLALVYKAESPVMYDAHNYAVEVYDEETEEYSDNYGLWVNLRWDAVVLNTETNLTNIVLTDAYNTQWPAQEIIVDADYPNRMRVRFNDFNNASNPCTISYTPGTLSSGVVDVDGSCVEFNAAGLVPTFIPSPEFVSAVNDGNRTVIIEFDRPIVDITAHGMVVTGQEPNMSPQGEVAAVNYGIDSVAIVEGDPTKIQINLTYAGRIKHPQGDIVIEFNGSIFGQGNAAVAPFVEQFTPTGITPWFMPNDPENITVSPIMSLVVSEVNYQSAQSGDEAIKAMAYSMSVTVTKVGELPL